MNPSAVNDKIMPDLEDLAAYLDNMLPDDRRAAVEGRLAEDPEYYEIFLDTVRFREEERTGESEAPAESRGTEVQDAAEAAPESIPRIGPKEAVYDVAAAGSVPYRYVAASLAAAAVLMLALVWKPWQVFHALQQDKTFFAQTNAEALDKLETHVRGWSVFRSGGDPQEVPEGREQEVAFRLGAYQVHLEMALRAKDQDAAIQALGSVERELDRLPQFLIEETLQLQGLKGAVSQESVAWDEVSSDSKTFQKSLDSVFSREKSQRDAERWGRWSEQALLLYLGGRREALQEHLEGPPPGLDHREDVSRALQGMGSDSESVPGDDFEKTPFLEAHEDLEESLGG